MTFTLRGALRRASATAVVAATFAGAMTLATPIASAAATNDLHVNPAAVVDTQTDQQLTVSNISSTYIGTPVVDIAGPKEVGSPDSYATTNVTYNSSKGTLTADVDFTQDDGDAEPGTYVLELCQSVDTSCANPVESGTFDVDSLTPTVTSVSPSTIADGTSQTVTFTGQNLSRGSTISFDNAGTSTPTAGITVSKITYVSTTSITATVAASGVTTATKAPVPTDVLIKTYAGQTGTLKNGLTVDPVPAITSFDPTDLGDGGTNVPLNILGTQLQAGATVTIQSALGVNEGVTVAGPATAVSGGIQVSVSIGANTPAGSETVTVTNPDGGKTTSTINIVAAPTLSGSNSHGQGFTGDITITSSVAQPAGKSVRSVSTTSNGITITGAATMPTTTTVQIPVAISGSATVGNDSVTIEFYDGATATCSAAGCLTVIAGPVVTGVSPSTISRTAPTTVTVSGTNFSGTTFTVPGFTVKTNSITQGTSPDATASVTITPGSPEPASGPTNITATNTDGGTSVCDSCLTAADYSITSLNITSAPDEQQGGDSIGPFVITATGPAANATDLVMELAPRGDVPQQPTIMIPGTVNAAGTKWTANAPYVFTDEADTDYTVSLDEIENGTVIQSGSFDTKFVVSSASPTVTALSPSTIGQGGTESLTVTGMNLTNGTAVSFPKVGGGLTGGTITGLSTNTTTGLGTGTVVVSASSTATTGSQSAEATDAANQTGTATSGAITVVVGPTITSVSTSTTDSNMVATVGQGATNHAVSISGTGFASGATVTVGSGSETLTPANVVVSPTSITFTVNVPTADAAALLDVTVTNPDGGTATDAGSLHVTTAPMLHYLTPNHGQPGATVADVISGSGFEIGGSAASSTEVTGTSLTVTVDPTNSSSTSLSASIAVAAGAADPSTDDLTVTNPDGGVSVLSKGFVIQDQPTISSVGTATTDSNGTATVGQGAVDHEVTVDGTQFVSGATVSLTQGNATLATSNLVVAGDGKSLTFDVSPTTATTTGDYVIIVTDPDNESARLPSALDVTAAPIITTIDPATGTPGSTTAGTISGTGFEVGADVTSTTTADATGVSFTVAPATSTTSLLAVSIAIDADATTGSRDVTATNPDGGTSVCTSCFNVGTAPTAPLAPTNVVATTSDTTGLVTWKAPTSDGGSTITSYSVVEHPASGSTVTKSASGTATSATFTGLAYGKTYTFTVTAKNSIGAGGSATSNKVVPQLVAIAVRNSSGETAVETSHTLKFQTLSGLKITGDPVVTHDSADHVYVVAQSKTGNEVYVRTLTVGWKKISTSACKQPAAAITGGKLWVACLSSKGQLLVGSESLKSGSVPSKPITFTNRGGSFKVGPAVAVSGSTVEILTVGKKFNSSGDDAYLSTGSSKKTKHVSIACTGAGALAFNGGKELFACADGSSVSALSGGSSSLKATHLLTSATGRVGVTLRAAGTVPTVWFAHAKTLRSWLVTGSSVTTHNGEKIAGGATATQVAG